MSPAQPLDIVLRLADEGVPLQAIARATRTPSGDLRGWLEEAVAEGRLLSLPRIDWPPGSSRGQRALQLSRLPVAHKDALRLTIGRVFGLTSTEAKLLQAMLQHELLERTRFDMAGNTVDVHVSHLRKRLQLYGIRIETVWGCGYRIAENHRRKIMGLVKTAEAAGMA